MIGKVMTNDSFKNVRFHKLRPENITCGDPASRKGILERYDGSLEVCTFPCPMDYNSNEQVYVCTICGMKITYEDYK